MSDDEHNMSIMSLKHLSNDDKMDDDFQIDTKNTQDKPTVLTSSNKNNTNNNTTRATSTNAINQQTNSNTHIQTSSTEINSDSKKAAFNYVSSCTLNRASFTDIAFLNQSNPEFPIDQNSAGAVFLRQMFQSNQPMKNYMNFLKKDSVDLTDEKDAMVVMQVLQKPTKSKNECDFLLKSIQGLHLFQKNKDMLTMKDCNQHLLEKLRLEYYPARKTIFNYGDFGYTYYIVLQGECDLLIPAPVVDSSEKLKREDSAHSKHHDKKDGKTGTHHGHHQNHTTTHPTHHGNTDSLQSDPEQKEYLTDLKENVSVQSAVGMMGGNLRKKKMKLDSKWNVLKKTFNPDQENMVVQEIQSPQNKDDNPNFNEDESQEDFLKRCFVGMKYMKTFKPGEAFGEIALMTKQRRTGTLVCRENTFLMALTKESFDIILGAYHENIIQRKLNFLKSYNFFRSMPNSKLLALLHLMKIVNYSNKNIVYTENDPSRFLYFIREGEVEISQICNIESNVQKEKKQKEEGDDYPNEINVIKTQKENRNRMKRVPLVIKGKNSYFGEEEILKHVDRRKQQAICSSETAEIFLIKKDILYNYTRGYSVIERLKEEFKVKGEWNQIRQAKIVQTTQTTKNDIEKQINLLQFKKPTSSMSTIQEPKVFEPKPSVSNIFSTNANRLSLPANPVSMNSINSSGNKRSSLLNQFNSNNNNISRTPSQGGNPAIEPFEVMTSKQRLSLRTNPFNSNSLSTLQKQLELSTLNNNNAAHLKLNQNQANYSSSDDNTDHFFSTGFTGSVPTNASDKLTPETKIHLKLNPQRKTQFNSTGYNSVGAESHFGSTYQKIQNPQTLAEEESYIENKILHNKMKKYLGDSKKTKEQLQQVALEQFGDLSHNAFVNKVGQTIEYKMQILKKLNSNGLQSPTNVFADLYEEFGLKKKFNFKVRRSVVHSNSATPKDSGSKTYSAPNGHEFQKRILMERKMEIKENIKKQNTQTYIEDINLVSEQVPEYILHRGKTFHQPLSYSLTDTNNHPEQFVRNKNRASTTINFHRPSISSSSQDSSKRFGDRQKSFDEVSLSGYESQTSSSQSITIPMKRNSFGEKGQKNISITAAIKNLDVLEEVSENNSPVKITKDLSKMRLSNISEVKNRSQQEYGLSQSQVLPNQFVMLKKSSGSQNRIILESISSNNNETAASSKCNSQIHLDLKKQSSSGSNMSNKEIALEPNEFSAMNIQSSSLYSSKSFMNRNTTSLKQKQEARRAVSRNSSSKENSFKITTTKQNNFFSLQKSIQTHQSHGNLHSHV